jgi:hypothetical protein
MVLMRTGEGLLCPEWSISLLKTRLYEVDWWGFVRMGNTREMEGRTGL